MTGSDTTGRPRRLPRVARIARTLIRQGPACAARLLWIYLGSPRVAALQPRRVSLWRRAAGRADPWAARFRIARLRRKERALIAAGRSGYRCATEELDLAPETRLALEKERASGREPVELGWIDQDGFFVLRLGPIGGLPQLSEEQAMLRRRTAVSLVDLDGTAAIRKSYCGDRVAFANEVAALDALTRAGLRVPAILRLDFDEPALYESFIPGPVVREELAKLGAQLRDRDVARDPAFADLPRLEQRRRRIQEGRRRLGAVMDESCVGKLVELVRSVHELGFIGLDVKYGNVVLERRSGLPYLIDFGELRRGRGLGRWGRTLCRDAEIEAVNEHFGTELVTRARLQRRLSGISAIGRVYAPVHFGADLRLGGIWDDSAGFGRWLRMLDRHMPELAGRRVLDVGANNGANALEMLRRGAREVVAIELEEDNVEQGKVVRAGVEWADNRRYQLRYIRSDMRAVPEMQLGRFDLVTALCCIYYLSDEEIEQLVRHFRSIAGTLVLQCNTARGIGRRDPDVYRRASVEYNLAVLHDGGFPDCRVIAPPGYSRPLIIGTAGVRKALETEEAAAVSS